MITKTGSHPRSAVTRAKLRRAAIDVFAQKGFHEAKISDIVAAAALSQPTFYIYFPSKEAAYAELVEEFRASLREATLQCLISPGLSPHALLGDVRQSFLRFLGVLTEDPSLSKIGFFNPPEGDTTKRQMLEWMISNMEQEQRAGILRGDIPAPLQARLVLGLLDQMIHLHGEMSVSKLADACARMFCTGLAAAER